MRIIQPRRLRGRSPSLLLSKFSVMKAMHYRAIKGIKEVKPSFKLIKRGQIPPTIIAFCTMGHPRALITPLMLLLL